MPNSMSYNPYETARTHFQRGAGLWGSIMGNHLTSMATNRGLNHLSIGMQEQSHQLERVLANQAFLLMRQSKMAEQLNEISQKLNQEPEKKLDKLA